MLFPSPRNSPEGNLAVIRASNCHIFLVNGGLPPNFAPVLAEDGMRTINMLEQAVLLDSAHVPPYPYRKSFDEARHDSFAFLHTSGTTGMTSESLRSTS